PRSDHLHVLPPARVPPGRARARAGDQGDGGAPRPARPAVPGVPCEGRAVVPRVPRVHDAVAVRVPLLRPAARVALAGLSLLRDGHPARAALTGRVGIASASRTSSGLERLIPAATGSLPRAIEIRVSADFDLCSD